MGLILLLIEVQLHAADLDAKEGNFMPPSCRHKSDTALYIKPRGYWTPGQKEKEVKGRLRLKRCGFESA